VFLNGTNEEVTLPLSYYAEILKDKSQGKEIISGQTIELDKELTMTAKESMIIEL